MVDRDHQLGTGLGGHFFSVLFMSSGSQPDARRTSSAQLTLLATVADPPINQSADRSRLPSRLLEPSLLSRAFEKAGRQGHGGRPPVRQVVHEHIQHWRPGRVKP